MPDLAGIRNRLRRTPPWARLALVLVALYGANLVANLVMVDAANHQEIITQEELSATFKNPTFFVHRLQPIVTDTNGGDTLTYLVGSQVLGTGDLFYGRTWKALLMAGLAPLVYLVLRRRLGVDALPAFAASGLLIVQPGLYAFGWLSTNYGLECVPGLLAVYLALSDRRSAVVWSGVALGYAAAIYGSGLAFVLPVGIAWLLRLYRSKERRRDLATCGGAGLLAVATLTWPIVWWTNSDRILLGGAFGPPDRQENLRELVASIVSGRESYYYYAHDRPVIVVAMLLLALVGIGLVLVRWPRWWVPASLGIGGAAIYINGGGILGIRRAVPVTLALVLFAGLGLGWAWNQRTQLRTVPVFRVATMLVVGVAFLLGAVAYAHDRTALADGRLPLAQDAAFPNVPGQSMAATADDLVAHASSEQIKALVGPGYVNTLPMIQMRRGDLFSDGGLWPLIYDTWRRDVAVCEGKACAPAPKREQVCYGVYANCVVPQQLPSSATTTTTSPPAGGP